MTHLDRSILATYNSLVDPNLQSYFSNDRIRSHLKHAGLISGRGDIVSDNEYRTRLAKREHKRHVRHMLAENIVNQAIDMERMRQAKMKSEFEMVAKLALVHNAKETKRRNENFSGSIDMGLISTDPCWIQKRPKSANYQDEIYNEHSRIPRIQSAHINSDHRIKYSSKTPNSRRRSRHRSNINRSSSAQRHRSPTRSPDSSCEITMVYFGPHTKVDYDHLVFESTDEIIVMQQHCGGENLTVHKDYLKPGDEFQFKSRRHSDYTFGLSLYINGLIDSRISTCCEYKHRHGVKLGGDRGHFAIKSVYGSKPCIKCTFEKQARLKKYAQSPKQKNDENKKPLIIPIPISDQSKIKHTPVKIPVRLTSISNENYSEDFDGSDRQKQSFKDGYSTDSSSRHSRTNKRKTQSKDSTPKVPQRTSPIDRHASLSKSSSTLDVTSREDLTKKTWQIIFYPSNISTKILSSTKEILLKFSFLSNDKKNETEIYEINMKQFRDNSKSTRQYSFPIKLKDIGKPEEIKLKIHTTVNDDDDDDDDDEEDLKWHLDHIELIDPKTQDHLIFQCKEWIRPSQEKILQLLQESPRDERKRKSSMSTNSSRSTTSPNKTRQQSPKFYQKPKISSRSSMSSDTSEKPQTKFDSSRRISSDNRLNQIEKETPRSDISEQENKTRYRLIIYPSNDDDGEFIPDEDSRIYIRINNQTQEINLINKSDQSCPKFKSNEKQTFEIDLILNKNEQPNKLTIGYINSNDTANKWKIQKITLINIETNDEFIFPCKEILRRKSNFRAEKTFQIQSNQSEDESTPRNQKIDSPKFINREEIKPSPKLSDQEELKSSPKPSDQEERKPSPKQQNNNNNTNREKSPSFQSMADDDAHYRKIFNQLDPDDELELGSPPHSPTNRPKTRRGRQDQEENNNHSNKQNSLPITTNENANNEFKTWYQKNDNDDDDDDNSK